MVMALGEFAPWVVAASCTNPRYGLATAAGRYILIAFLGSTDRAPSRAALDRVLARRALFDDASAAFFGVLTDRADQAERGVRQDLPGLRYFWDFDGAVSAKFGAAQEGIYKPHWVVLDPMMRAEAAGPLDQIDAALNHIATRRGQPRVSLPAPVLTLPHVFERSFCERLINDHKDGEPQASGFMREQDGKTVQMRDDAFKRRADVEISDEALRAEVRARISTRLVPAIKLAFQYQATRIERYLVARYDGETGGFFRPHRDNTTKGTAHRRFAVTINLNAEDYEGGDLRFPEFGPQSYRAPTGGAVVFSCSLLHEALPVTAGQRFAFLPFLYDDEAAKIREKNNEFLGEGVSAYRT